MLDSHPSVVVIYHCYPHYRRAIVELLAQSKRADFTFVGDDHEYLHSVETASFSPNVRFHLAPARHLFGPFMWQWGAVRWAICSRFDTVIMHAVPHWPCTWIGAIAARLLGKKVFFWGHGYLSRPQGLKGLIRRLFYPLPHQHLFYGRLSKAYAMDLGWPAERLHVIYNSLDLVVQQGHRKSITPAICRALREELFGNADTPVVICTTRLIAMRRLDLLLESLAQLKRQGTNANLILVGEGPERTKLISQAERLGVRVHLEGACYDEARIASLIMASNVTVSPGRTGLTAIHSLVYGVPVVSHGDPDDQAPEWEAIIPGKTGSYFERGSAASLAVAMRPWLESGAVTEQTRAACIDVVERFWNPEFQCGAIERAVCGDPATDLPVCKGKGSE